MLARMVKRWDGKGEMDAKTEVREGCERGGDAGGIVSVMQASINYSM